MQREVESRVIEELETERIAGDLMQVLGRDEPTVRRLLQEESSAPGSTVANALAEKGIEPYIFSKPLEEFYGQSDAFVFELVVWNRNRVKAAMLRWTGEWIDAEAKRLGRPLRVLTFGDGIGVDSAAIALRGHQVTYFDFPGYTERLARRLFGKLEIKPQIITQFADLPAGQFDAITCLDVLEHVPQPRELITSLVGLLDVGGVMFVHAPFYLILPAYPTHLKSNRRYAGRLGLFERSGLELVEGRLTWNPLVFRKGGRGPSISRTRRALLRTVGLVFQTGRHTSIQFRLLHKLIRG